MDKLKALRALMKERGLDAYLIPSGDAHASEYVADYWNARSWFSGFTGSSGLVVVTHTEAGLWTDGRYFIQAENQLSGSEIKLFKMATPGVPEYKDYLADALPQHGKLGFDGRVVDTQEFEELREALKAKEITYAYSEDLVGLIWEDRPAMPTAPAFEHTPRIPCATTSEKLTAVRAEMAKHDVSAYLISALDDVAWLMNIRGRDMAHTPIAYAYAVITASEAHLFIDPGKVSVFAGKLEAQGVTLHDYDGAAGFMGKLEGKLLINPRKTSMLLVESLPKGLQVKKDLPEDAIQLLKAIKSTAELENTRNAYIKESVALVRFLKWLEECPDVSAITEEDVVRKLTSLRELMPDFLEDSFSTIAAYGANAAQAHYRPGTETVYLKPEGFLLIDTGGQYMDGTTDTTRTIRLGPITDEMKRNFTLVLKGHIAISKVKFAEKTTGIMLDSLARVALWEHGLDFRHGTGHGIGFCLGVHEGPQGISRKSTVELVPGMLLSNEPAFYVDGEYGIRTENIIEVVKRCETEYGAFYGFESLLYCPIDMSSVDVALLDAGEIEYLNEYHKRTYDLVAPHLTADEAAWLKKATMSV